MFIAIFRTLKTICFSINTIQVTGRMLLKIDPAKKEMVELCSAGLMLGHCLRRWLNIKPALMAPRNHEMVCQSLLRMLSADKAATA